VTTRRVQVVTGNLNWEPSVQMSRGAQAVAKQQGVQAQLYDAHGDLEHDLAMLRQLPDNETDGAIILSLHGPEFNEALLHLYSRNFPFVLVDQHTEAMGVPTVTADNHAGGYLAGQALVRQGHRRIGFVGDLIASTVRDRLAGLRDAIADAGLPFDRSQVVDLTQTAMNRLGDWSVMIDQETQRLLERPDRPTAIFFSCDAVARPAYRTVARLGLRIPQDVSVVGFDDDPLAEWLAPPLTTVAQPFFEMGRAAMELLCARMADPRATLEHRRLPVMLRERESIAPPAATGSGSISIRDAGLATVQKPEVGTRNAEVGVL
jgi:LacI family transcriptional regulator